ncbi:MAG: glutamate racemase [Desulfobacterales bacterium]|nr:glutamate racemase [Desulfobacterales bacterium]
MIGVFDSGIGGLTVVRALREQLPGYDIVYFGDTARAPYGTKSPKTVIDYANEIIAFLIAQGAQLIVMACNTVSSVATATVTEQFSLPIFDVVTPAVDQAVGLGHRPIIGVIGTRATIASNIYERKIKKLRPDAKVHSKACPLLVPLVEEGWLQKPETVMIVKKYLHPLKVRQVNSLILGCTHYPVIKKVIQRKIGKQVHIIDSSLAVAAEVAAYISRHPELGAGIAKHNRLELFVSDITTQFKKTAQMLFKQHIQLELQRL